MRDPDATGRGCCSNRAPRQQPQRLALAARPCSLIEPYSVEIGYWLAQPLWGTGIATAAVRCFCDYCFTELNLLRLYALPFGDNPGSVRVLEKAGFTREGVLKAAIVKDGVVHDYVIYARINPRWNPPA